MHRRSRPIPLAAWIASRNPVLRVRAETALYHFGPDAGDALFAAAEAISRYVSIKRQLVSQPMILLGTALLCSCVDSLALRSFQGELHELSQLLAAVAIVQALVQMAQAFGDDLVMRRKRLKVLGLALVKRDDLRGIGPLLEAWRPLSFSGRQIRDEEVELELTRILPQFLAQKSFDLRSYKKRSLRRKMRRLFPYSLALHRVESRGEFSETRADLIVTLIQLLSRSSSEADQALIERIGRMSPTGSSHAYERNAVFIRDAALAYHAATSPREITSPLPLVPATTPSTSAAPQITTLSASAAPQIPAVAKRS